MTYSVKVSRLLQERLLKVFFVDMATLGALFDAQRDEHLTSVAHRWPINDLSAALFHYKCEKCFFKVIANIAVANDVVAEQAKSKVVNIVDIILLDVNAILLRKA